MKENNKCTHIEAKNYLSKESEKRNLKTFITAKALVFRIYKNICRTFYKSIWKTNKQTKKTSMAKEKIWQKKKKNGEQTCKQMFNAFSNQKNVN